MLNKLTVSIDKYCDTHKKFMCQLNQSVQLDNYAIKCKKVSNCILRHKQRIYF